jgi:hypothetical protein
LILDKREERERERERGRKTRGRSKGETAVLRLGRFVFSSLSLSFSPKEIGGA